MRRAVPVVAQIRDEPLQREYARRLAGWVGWPDPDEVLQQVRAEAHKPKKQQQRRTILSDSKSNQVPATPAPMIRPPSPRETHLWPQREALKVALQFPGVAGAYFDGVDEEAFTNEAYRVVRNAIITAGGATKGAQQPTVEWIANVAGEMLDLTGRNSVSEFAHEEILPTGSSMEDYADMVLSRLQESQVGNHIAEHEPTVHLKMKRPTTRYSLTLWHLSRPAASSTTAHSAVQVRLNPRLLHRYDQDYCPGRSCFTFHGSGP